MVLTIGTSHPEVHLYMIACSYPILAHMHLWGQVAALLHTQSSSITLQLMDVQMQAGSYNCGQFTAAFATAFEFTRAGQFHAV